MWNNRRLALGIARAAAAPFTLSAALALSSSNLATKDTTTTTTECEADPARLLHKRQTLKHAQTVQRFYTRAELSKLRRQQTEILRRWEKDEEGWRTLPARAWPAHQPNEDEMKAIQQTYDNECRNGKTKTQHQTVDQCQELQFQIATTLVFYNIDPQRGLSIYQELAKNGHVDAMVACGVVLVEGFGVEPQENVGLDYLRRAAKLGSSQAMFELGTVYYTGLSDILDEDPKQAVYYFELAAQSNHTGALYMLADCLVEGEGVDTDVGRAVPLLYQAAERGHRFARQRIRELLAHPKYKEPSS